ncbi:hypothetical protein [Virgisporangium aurantiacum]|uniref:Uncharacterized protein n=1 Tax=Virgisporangium aurantiacum TaxID=175570 RepID=A0A8J3Z1P6_9ACTN|nr:hypothetical protein [Virgisporangium aurantiacum]GIJ54917.1 hypothetical protein Vau01_024330 [Virgisporangium aurantiacum]
MRLSRIAAAAVALAAGGAALLPATAANADTPDLGLVVPLLSPMLPGQSGWVGTMWAAADDICGLKVTASGANVTVTYPGNTATFASLSKADTLKAGAMDYTAFKLSVPTTAPIALIPMQLTATYTEVADGATTCVGTKKTVTANATLPVVAPIGDAVVQKTSSVTLTRTAPAWTQISYLGRKSGVTNFRVTVTAPAGMTVVYPADGTSSGLNGGPVLGVGVEDYAAVRLDATALKAGTYTATVKATWDGGSSTDDLKIVVA